MFRRLFGRGQDAPRDEQEAAGEAQQVTASLAKSRQGIFGRIAQLFTGNDPITDALWDELEEALIQADVGLETTQFLVNRTIDRVNRNGVKKAGEARDLLKTEMVRTLAEVAAPRPAPPTAPFVVMVVGVNGAGKTTLIAKLAHRYRNKFGKKVLLAAGDTFRAAATEQLETWAERAGVPCVSLGQGADAAAVVFKAIDAALEQQVDILIIDTAGRLQAKQNLMLELEKVRTIITRKLPGAPHETLLVIDGTTGQNGVLQAKAFLKSAQVTDVAVTKLDGTAKGGIAFAVAQDIERPIRYIGTGEKIDDLAMFDAQTYVDALFAESSAS
jgi:fused signal recognition particle receptor